MMLSDNEIPLVKLTLLLRVVCLLTIVLLIASASIEMSIIFHSWWFDDAYTKIINSYINYYPELENYDIPRRGLVYLGTFLLDCLNNLPYYAAMLFAALLFFNFYKGKVWWYGNISLLKTISILLMLDGLSPVILTTLQMLLFSASGKIILTLYVGFSAEAVRVLIVGFTLLVFCWVLSEARKLIEERTYFI